MPSNLCFLNDNTAWFNERVSDNATVTRLIQRNTDEALEELLEDSAEERAMLALEDEFFSGERMW